MPPRAAAHNGLPCGNPVLLAFLEEWGDQARGTDRERTYRQAASSMRACPFTFQHPSEAKTLIGIGDKIAERLTKKYIEYKENRGETPPPLIPYQKPQKPNATKRKSGQAEDHNNAATNLSTVPGESMDSLFDDGEPVLGRWDTARAPKKKKKKTAKGQTAGSNVVSLDGDDNNSDDGDEPQPAKKPRKPRAPKMYVPRPRTGGYAILRALGELPEGERVTKDELMRRAQPYCDSSFTLAGNPGENHKYTAWNSVKTLKENNLVTQKGRPALFSLTEYGWDTLDKMIEVEEGIGGEDGKEDETDVIEALGVTSAAIKSHQQLPPRPRVRSASAQPVTNAPPDIKTPFTPKYLRAGHFEVHLVLDNREVASKTDRDYIQRSFENANCSPITRAMELGDVMWVARGRLYENGKETSEEIELSLDHVCERKRLDDLIGSIKDGRFHEQKFRLGKLIGNVTYIIEVPNGRINVQTAHLTDSITTAIYSTQVVNGFFVKLSPNLDDTVRYLARFTRLLKQTYEGKDLYLYPENLVQVRTFSELKEHLREQQPGRDYCLSYGTLAAMASKSRTSTLRDVFLKMLMCTRGVSAEKALEIQRHFKTPRELLERYSHCQGSENVGKMMMMGVVDVAAKTDRRKVKGALSGKIWEVWGN
ncbi:hypothetical protein DRE_03381 [Drechslerella stenobrocha 248]|uniref:Crossover junction endonuclease MUS81 n=1 Tax=Drechslerella stenobrocha 248 TaxID=1043628 RepID=W7I491_9PEZI|nr:hypothetical protein DRE_03381 [Drechslerella stenobrocha 248]